ncbi:MAG TPA: RHS repeat-associated core domain-containing protein, partial [Verrucomicrobiae bacterium]|nr:RHS repeat-associated core domain-containing protein [Verrucomicrobiae bacterium]
MSGTPIISAVNVPGPNGKPVASASTGSKGGNQYTIPANNSAATVARQTSQVKLGDGSATVRKFDNRGNQVSLSVTGPNGATATETQSNTVDGLVWYIQHAEGDTETMTYDSNNPVFRSRGNLLAHKIDPGPRGGQIYLETNSYDARYNLQSGVQMDANGFPTTITLMPDGRDVQSIDYNGVGTKTAEYNSLGQLTHSVDENGVEHVVTYDSSTGFITSDASGQVVATYNYDGSVASQLGWPASIAPQIGAATTLLYNNHMQPVETDRGSLISQTAYDELGRPVYHIEKVGGGKQWSETRAYDDKGFITNTVRSGIEVNGTETSLSTFYTSDNRSRVKTILHPNGTLQTLQYDNQGNVVSMTMGDYTEQYGHDLNNNLTTVTQGGDLVRVLQYDGLDQVTNVLRKTGNQDYQESTGYYPGGEVKSFTVTDPQYGVVRQVTYDQIDALGRTLTVTMHGNVISPKYTYSYSALSSGIDGPRMSSTTTWDTAGNQTSYSDPNLKTTVKLDADGRALEADNQEDGAAYSVFYGYDDFDNQVSIGDLLGTKFTFLPRADGNYLQISNALGHATSLEHTAIGELLRKQRADGMEVDYRHDTERQTVYEGDPGAGFSFGFDSNMRMTNSSLRNGALFNYGSFDPRSMPTAVTMPGGSQTLQYDQQRQLLQRKLNYQSTPYEEDFSYDALGRVRSETYIQNGSSDNATFTFDPAGPLTQAKFHEGNSDFTVAYGYYPDGGRQSITYPSGITVTENRDPTGRLIGLSEPNGNIIKALSWHGNNEPASVQLGAAMTITNTFDKRGRLVGSIVVRQTDGAVLTHMRYQYDLANNLQIRQFVHRGGRADVFDYDAGERITHAQIGVLVTNASGSGPDLFTRNYSYHANGLDYLTGSLLSGPLANPPVFATNWTAHDGFLLPGTVDGFSRGTADALGNVVQAELWVRSSNSPAPQAISATLEHDGRSRLFRVTRADGLTIENMYQAGGLRFSRKIFQGAQLIAYSGYVYDSSARLLEEYDRTGGQPKLIARYYYGGGDAPVAADLLDSVSGQLQRYYYLRDAAQSVIAVADKNGNVVERAWYDTFGQPWLERRDAAPPAVRQITADSGGALLISMSEPVLPAWSDPGPGGGVVVVSSNLQNAFTLSSGTGTVSIVPAPSGQPAYSVIRFVPSQAATGTVTMTLNAGRLSDEWANLNSAKTFTLTNLGAPVGTVYFTGSTPDTSPVRLARSDVGSPILFQGQYFDYDAGLLYLRARFYDPYSGMFFEPDPLGYEDSVNHYAGLGNNPASARDPSGLRTKGVTQEHYFAFLKSHGFNSGELRLLSKVHGQLSNFGMSDLEIAAHVRVMYVELTKNKASWEISIRKFGSPDKVAQRIARMDEFHQTKPEWVHNKSGSDALVHEKGKTFTSDLDGLYAKRNGQVATRSEIEGFQAAVNQEVSRLSSGWRELTGAHGQEFHGQQIQKAYQHGFTLNIPQQWGMKHDLSPGGKFGLWAYREIQSKMKKGTGEAFAFKLDNLES